MIEIDVNKKVWVKLKPNGTRMYDDHYANLQKYYELEMDVPPLKTDEFGWSEFRFVDFMLIFGQAGGTQAGLLYEPKIRFDEKDTLYKS